MIDHIGLAVTDMDRSRPFYEAALAPLGLTVLSVETPDEANHGRTVIMFGSDAPSFVIADGERPGEGTHVAFKASSREAVAAFHRAAIGAGGLDNGEPGIRTRYGPAYYAAFVLDPDGINVEAVCHLQVEAPG